VPDLTAARAALGRLLAAGSDPGAYLSRADRPGRRPAVGYVCSYVPEEILLAAGLHPVRLGARPGPVGPADSSLQSFACSFSRACLDGLLSGLGGDLAGVVFAYTCDSLRAAAEIWKTRRPAGSFYHFLNLPARLDGPGSARYTASAFRRLAGDLASVAGARPVSAAGLAAAARLTAAVRGGLARLAEVRSARPDLLPGSAFLAAARGATVVDREEGAADLIAAATVLEAAAAGSEPARTGRRRILVSGGFLETDEPVHLIEEAGADVVADDLCLGARWLSLPDTGTGDAREDCPAGDPGSGPRPSPLAADPFDRLAQAYLARVPCPAKHPPGPRFDFVRREAEARSVDGVVFLLQKFCDPHAFDYPDLAALLAASGRPSLVMEIEQGGLTRGQARTRLEAFVERLRAGRSAAGTGCGAGTAGTAPGTRTGPTGRGAGKGAEGR
jgi:benzoyl-CoA reductase/2-hydroxyglutaryl-CoA dehydratase subunit BcrC/BadD/HgdB